MPAIQVSKYTEKFDAICSSKVTVICKKHFGHHFRFNYYVDGIKNYCLQHKLTLLDTRII